MEHQTENSLNIIYRRNAGASYMILPQIKEVCPYEEEMLKNNDIPVLLPFFSFWDEGQKQLWFDITGKKSIKHVLEQDSIDKKRLCGILLSVLDAYDVLAEFLIDDTHILLHEDTVFIGQCEKGEEIFLCYSPDESGGMEEGLISLFECIMPRIGREDDALVSLIYDGYRSLCDGSFTKNSLREKAAEAILEIPQSIERIPENEEPENESYDMDFKSRDYEEEPEDEDFYELEEKRSLLDSIKEKISEAKDKVKGRFKKKKDEYFPPKDLEEDFIYDPGERLSQPTVLLSENAEGNTIGRLVYEGSGEEKDFVLDMDEYRVGSKAEGSDIRLHSAAVSRRHAILRKKGDAYWLEDLNSTNGTFVNGKPVNVGEPCLIKAMDKIRFADVEYRMV